MHSAAASYVCKLNVDVHTCEADQITQLATLPIRTARGRSRITSVVVRLLTRDCFGKQKGILPKVRTRHNEKRV